jgi:hypothetical protein
VASVKLLEPKWEKTWVAELEVARVTESVVAWAVVVLLAVA